MVALSLPVQALFFTVLTLVHGVKPAHAVKIDRPVHDQAQVFSTTEKEAIAKRLLTLTSRTDAQMAVLTVKSLGGEKIETFARRTASAWGGGRRGRDDGLLLVLAPKEHRIRLEVGAGLTAKLPNERVQVILDDVAPALKERRYDSAVLNIIGQLESNLRWRSSRLGLERSPTPLAVAVGTLATAAAVRAAGNKRAPDAGRAPSPGSSAAPQVQKSTPSEPQFEDQAALDSFLMKKFFLLLSFISLGLGLVFGHSRLRQGPGSFTQLFSYVTMIGLAATISWFASVSLGSPKLSPAVLSVTLAQAFSGMRAAMVTHLKRRIGPDDDFELVARTPPGQLLRLVLPGVVATLVLGVVLRLPGVPSEQLLAIVGSALIGLGHALALHKLNEQLDAVPLPPPGSGERICTSPLGRRNADGVHVHERDDSLPPPDETPNNDTDNRGSGGTFKGDGATSSW